MLKLITASLLIVPIAFGQTTLTTAQIAKKVSPSVVVIQGRTESGEVLGSGFIVSKDGKIVTNLHVIRDMKTATVQLANGEMFGSVSVLAVDERRDLALVQIAGFDLPVLELGDSEVLTVGEPLVIVGSPRGLEGTVTAGILSSVRDSGEGLKVLQTDATVNPGNSGGPLVNNKGQAVGIVSFKLRSAEGLNFAVPISYLRGLLNALHEPFTLDQMRRSLVGTTSAVQQSGKPSLNETLDWLNEKIPLAVVNYLASMIVNGNRIVSTESEQGTARSFGSCTVIFGNVFDAHGDRPGQTFDSTTIYTVPLGALTAWWVKQVDTMEVSAKTFISGDRWRYNVLLGSNSAELSRKISHNFNALSEVERVKVAWVSFNDESLARRVAEAFHHASDLCRTKEAF